MTNIWTVSDMCASKMGQRSPRESQELGHDPYINSDPEITALQSQKVVRYAYS